MCHGISADLISYKSGDRPFRPMRHAGERRDEDSYPTLVILPSAYNKHVRCSERYLSLAI